MNASIPILSVVIGAVVLLFGRKLFWLCVAAIGFAAGVTLASHLVSEPTPLLQLTFAILLGITGAVSAKTGNRAGRFPRRRSACRWFGGDVYGAIHLVLLAYFYYRRIDWRDSASD